MSLLAKAAKKLGSDEKIMDSYWAYHEREQNWFFSPNPNLDSATSKPHGLPGSDSWKKKTSAERKQVWERLSLRQRMTISTLAGFGYEGRGINLDSNTHFSRLKQGLNDWRSDLYSVFWSDDARTGKRWLCNVFVGDAIYLYNQTSFTAANNHYYDPGQIQRGASFLKKRKSYKEVRPGDICVFRDFVSGIWSHVEIITSIKEYWIRDDGFCSIGAGRGKTRDEMGSIKCDSFGSRSIVRELDSAKHAYLYLR